jgi:hypothetical protein
MSTQTQPRRYQYHRFFRKRLLTSGIFGKRSFMLASQFRHEP